MSQRNFFANITHECFELICLAVEGIEHAFYRMAWIFLHSAVILKMCLIISHGVIGLFRIHYQKKTNDLTSKIIKTFLLSLSMLFSVGAVAVISFNPILALSALTIASGLHLCFNVWKLHHIQKKLQSDNLTSRRRFYLDQKKEHRRTVFRHNAGHFLGFCLIFFTGCISPSFSIYFAAVIFTVSVFSTGHFIHRLHQRRISFLLIKYPKNNLIDSFQTSMSDLPQLTLDAQLSHALHIKDISKQDTRILKKSITMMNKSFQPKDPERIKLEKVLKENIFVHSKKAKKETIQKDDEDRSEHP